MLFSHCALDFAKPSKAKQSIELRVRWHEKLLHCKSGNLFSRVFRFWKKDFPENIIRTHTHIRLPHADYNGDNLISFYRFSPPKITWKSNNNNKNFMFFEFFRHGIFITFSPKNCVNSVCVRVCVSQECWRSESSLEAVLSSGGKNEALDGREAFSVMEKINCALMLCWWIFSPFCHYVRRF